MNRTDKPSLGIQDVVNTHVEALHAEAAIADAVQLLLRRGYSGAPVVDAQQRVVGVLSEFDCLRVLSEAAYEDWPAGTVQEHMTGATETVLATADIFAVAQRFAESQLRRLPVVDADGRLVGLITRRDLLRGLDALVQARQPRALTTYELIARNRLDARLS